MIITPKELKEHLNEKFVGSKFSSYGFEIASEIMKIFKEDYGLEWSDGLRVSQNNQDIGINFHGQPIAWGKISKQKGDKHHLWLGNSYCDWTIKGITLYLCDWSLDGKRVETFAEAIMAAKRHIAKIEAEQDFEKQRAISALKLLMETYNVDAREASRICNNIRANIYTYEDLIKEGK